MSTFVQNLTIETIKTQAFVFAFQVNNRFWSYAKRPHLNITADIDAPFQINSSSKTQAIYLCPCGVTGLILQGVLT